MVAMMSPYDIIECMRCGRSELAGNAENWNTVFDQGAIVGHVCPDCQTDEEDIEAQVNDALMGYSKLKLVRTLGELIDSFHPLWVEALQIIAAGEEERGSALLREYLERFRKCWNGMNWNSAAMQLEDLEETYLNFVDIGELPEIGEGNE